MCSDDVWVKHLGMEKLSTGNTLHGGSKSDIPDIDQMIDANPCSKVYLALEECLIETNRSWKKCQQQVLSYMKRNNDLILG